MSLETFTRAYIEALYFTEAGPDSEIPADADIEPHTRTEIARECRLFLERAGSAIAEEKHEQAGHDFWLTRNGHGCGFWDGDWPEPGASMLDQLSKEFGQVIPFLNNLGRIETELHPDTVHTVQDWQDEVLRGHTLRGYYDWLESQIEQEQEVI